MTTNWGTPLPDRQEAEVLRNLEWVNSAQGQLTVTFRHRDNRIWVATIASLPADMNRTTFPEEAYSLSVTSDGCRAYQFICRSQSSGKRTTLRLANMRATYYSRLIADARGTTDYPRSDDIGVLCMQVAKRTQVRAHTHNPRTQATEVQRYTIRGIGRVDGNTITVFPESHELEQILDQVCAEGTHALVPSDINVIPDPSMARGALEGVNVDSVADDVVTAALANSFDDDAETALQGLSDGTYHTPAPRQREDRVIDIFGDPDEED